MNEELHNIFEENERQSLLEEYDKTYYYLQDLGIEVYEQMKIDLMKEINSHTIENVVYYAKNNFSRPKFDDILKDIKDFEKWHISSEINQLRELLENNGFYEFNKEEVEDIKDKLDYLEELEA